MQLTIITSLYFFHGLFFFWFNWISLKGLCHGSTVHFVSFCQLLALNRYGLTKSKQRNYM